MANEKKSLAKQVANMQKVIEAAKKVKSVKR